MKTTKYTLEELYNIMYSNSLQNVEFEDVLSMLPNLTKVKAVVSKDTAPMIGLNPFKTVKSKKDITIVKDFNEALNHRVSNYTDKK